MASVTMSAAPLSSAQVAYPYIPEVSYLASIPADARERMLKAARDINMFLFKTGPVSSNYLLFALYEACKNGNSKLAIDWIKAGISVNQSDILCALFYQLPDVVCAMVEAQVVFSPSCIVRTIKWACENNHQNVMDALSCRTDISLDVWNNVHDKLSGIQNEAVTAYLKKLKLPAQKPFIRTYSSTPTDVIDKIKALQLVSEQEMRDLFHAFIDFKIPNESALFFALQQGYGKRLSTLRGKKGTTALMCDLSMNVVQLLLQAGGDVKASNKSGDCCLSKAVERKNRELVELFLKNGADVNSCNRFRFPVLMDAMLQQSEELVDLFLARDDIDVNKGNGEHIDPLMLAVCLCDKGVVKRLLNKGATPSASTISGEEGAGYTALIRLAALGNSDFPNDVSDIAKMLLKKGADIDARLENGMSSLLFACRRNDPSLVKILLDAHADVNAQTPQGKTALMCVITECSEEVDCTATVQLLLEKDADVCLATPLLEAASRGVHSVCELIVNACPESKKEQFIREHLEPAIQIAYENGHDSLAEMLTRSRSPD